MSKLSSLIAPFYRIGRGWNSISAKRPRLTNPKVPILFPSPLQIESPKRLLGQIATGFKNPHFNFLKGN